MGQREPIRDTHEHRGAKLGPKGRVASLFRLFSLVVLPLIGTAPAVLALNVGYYEMCSGAGESWQIPPITTAGQTPVLLTDLAASDLSGVDVIFVTNCDNGGYGSEYTSRLADIANAVSLGKLLVIHDRHVDSAETILPGGATFTIVRDFSDDANIDVLDGSTILTNGPGGLVGNTTLDGGCSSSHGFAVAGSLPGSADLILSRTSPAEIVTFSYQYGSGHVVYSSIPLDFYLSGGSCQPNMAPIYAPNAVAYAASLACSDPVDTDGDGVGDSCDNCPALSNPSQRDCDLNGLGDACDPGTVDGDSDQVADACDNCPATANPGQEDGDHDGIGDACDACVGPGGDSDGDGICDGVDNCPSNYNPGQEDSDFDGIGDACDPCAADPSPVDFDGDGFCGNPGSCPAGCDNCPFTNNPDQADGDGDGRGDVCDNCPSNSNPGQEDSDFDGIGNACDNCVGPGGDSDGDAVCDFVDNCPSDPNPGQEDSDFDGLGDACDPCGADTSSFDFDGDGFCSNPSLCPAGCDNCPSTFNPGQADGDGDGVGDLCDNCPAASNPDQEDADGDGAGDACDVCLGTGTVDSDDDGLCDGADPCPTDPTQACATLFGCTGTGGAASTLYRINPANGIGLPVGPMGIFGCSGLAFHPTTDVLYAVGWDNSFVNSLWTVDTSTGAATLVGPTGQSTTSDLAFRSDGQLFSYHRFGPRAGTVSTTTGNVTLLGPSGLPSDNGNAITFDLSDTLLHAGAFALSSIDQTTGAATTLSTLAFPPVACGFPRINSMDTHSSGVVYGVMNCSGGPSSSNYLVTVGVPTGSVAAIAPSVPGLDGIAFAPTGVCGDGMPDFGEECDDGNTVDGDCCSSSCTFEPAGGPCPGDGSLCTIDTCDGAGSCVSALPALCKLAGKSVLLLKNKSDDAKDKLVFKWLKGAETDPSEFGNPGTTADYALCIYTGPLMTPLSHVTVPADNAKWKPLSTKGHKYKDGDGTADGVTNIVLKGGVAGKAKVLVKAKGAHLPDPTWSNLPLPVTVQVVNSETNACFESIYQSSDVKVDDGGQFKASAQ